MDNRSLAAVDNIEQLSVCCFLWDEDHYLNGMGREYVRRLYTATEQHLTIPHRFFLFFHTHSSRIRRIFGVPEGVCVLPFNRRYRRNLTKISAYNRDCGLTGRVLMLDLDIVILGNIDEIANYSGDFACCGEQAGGSVVSFRAGELHDKLYIPLRKNWDRIQQRTRGAERRYYAARLQYQFDDWEELFPGQIIGYKAHKEDLLNEQLNGARIVYFHGRPKPHELQGLRWLDENWRNL